MMARSTTCSNQRPDTLMQDRRRQFDEIFLQRAAGPYTWVTTSPVGDQGSDVRERAPSFAKSGLEKARRREACMLIPLADVPRWYAERKPKDTVAVSHGADTLTWEQLERGANRRARAFAARGVKPGDFVAIGLPNGNAFFETSFAVWKCGATPTSLSWRLSPARARPLAA